MYSDFGVFTLQQFYARRYEKLDPCCEDPFVYITYYLVIWRKPKFFLFNYIQPSVLINILALFVFLIPAESGEKITLGISTMLNMTIFLMTVSKGLWCMHYVIMLGVSGAKAHCSFDHNDYSFKGVG